MAASGTAAEIIIFTASDALKRDERLLLDLIDLAEGGAQAPQRQFWGYAVEQPDLIYWFFEWTARKAAMDRRTLRALQEQLVLISRSSPQRCCVSFPSPLTTCLSAPTTEIITAGVLPGGDIKRFEEVCDAAMRATEKGGSLGSVWGYDCDKRSVILLVGWESQDHSKFEKTDLYKETVEPFRQMATDVKLTHVKFQSK